MKEILLYGLIYPAEARDFGITDGITDKEIYDVLQELDGEDLHIRINSRGGGADAGFAIATLLEQYSGNVVAKIDGMAASAATIVACGCDRVEISKNGSVMIHKAHQFVFGEVNADDLTKQAAALNSYDNRIAALYERKTGTKAAEWMAKLADGDNYLTADEAVKAGLADEITEPVGVRLDSDARFETAPDWVQQRLEQFKNLDRPVAAAKLHREVESLLALDGIGGMIGGD